MIQKKITESTSAIKCNSSENCPTCGVKGKLITTIIQNETEVQKSSTSGGGLGVSLSQGGVGLIPMVGKASSTTVKQSKRAEILQEPEKELYEHPSIIFHAPLFFMMLLISLMFSSDVFFDTPSPDFYDKTSPENIMSLLMEYYQYGLFLMIIPLLNQIHRSWKERGNVLVRNDKREKRNRLRSKLYRSTRLCEECEILYNAETNQTSKISAKGLDSIITTIDK